MERVIVRIDLGRLRRRLSAAAGRAVSDADVHRWLNGAGFTLGDGWRADDRAVAALAPGEVIEQTTFERVDGITFVRTERPPPT